MTRPPHLSLFWSYLRIGAFAFGGGLAALPVFEAELVRRRRWLSSADVAEAYAISQSVPASRSGTCITPRPPRAGPSNCR